MCSVLFYPVYSGHICGNFGKTGPKDGLGDTAMDRENCIVAMQGTRQVNSGHKIKGYHVGETLGYILIHRMLCNKKKCILKLITL